MLQKIKLSPLLCCTAEVNMIKLRRSSDLLKENHLYRARVCKGNRFIWIDCCRKRAFTMSVQCQLIYSELYPNSFDKKCLLAHWFWFCFRLLVISEMAAPHPLVSVLYHYSSKRFNFMEQSIKHFCPLLTTLRDFIYFNIYIYIYDHLLIIFMFY